MFTMRYKFDNGKWSSPSAVDVFGMQWCSDVHLKLEEHVEVQLSYKNF